MKACLPQTIRDGLLLDASPRASVLVCFAYFAQNPDRNSSVVSRHFHPPLTRSARASRLRPDTRTHTHTHARTHLAHSRTIIFRPAAAHKIVVMDDEMGDDHAPAPPIIQHKVTAAINWGTVNLAVSVSIDNSYSQPINLAPNCPDTPQKLAWDGNGKFIWGHDIESALKRKDIQSEDVIELFKLCLYDDFTNERIPRRVREQLARKGKNIYDLLSEHLSAIMLAVRAALKNSLDYVGLLTEDVSCLGLTMFCCRTKTDV